MLKRLWFRLTAYVPRRIPMNRRQFEAMQSSLVHGFGLADEPLTWIAVCGELSSVHGHKLRIPWGYLANKVKRIEQIRLCQSYREQCQQELNRRLKVAIEAQVAKTKLVDGVLAEFPKNTRTARTGDPQSLQFLKSKICEAVADVLGCDPIEDEFTVDPELYEILEARLRHDEEAEKQSQANGVAVPPTEEANQEAAQGQSVSNSPGKVGVGSGSNGTKEIH